MQRGGSISLRLLLILAVLLTVGAGWYLFFTRKPESPRITSVSEPSVPARNSPSPELVRPLPEAPVPSLLPPVQRPPRAATAQEIEAEYAQAPDTESRAEAARNLASLDTAASLQTLSRLFAAARAYPDRTAIVGALADSHSEDTLDAKLAILRAALAQGQVRQVRSVAVDVAAQIDDPRAIDLLRQAAKLDPDSQIRELARAALSSE
jgi:hypothetical protein